MAKPVAHRPGAERPPDFSLFREEAQGTALEAEDSSTALRSRLLLGIGFALLPLTLALGLSTRLAFETTNETMLTIRRSGSVIIGAAATNITVPATGMRVAISSGAASHGGIAYPGRGDLCRSSVAQSPAPTCLRIVLDGAELQSVDHARLVYTQRASLWRALFGVTG